MDPVTRIHTEVRSFFQRRGTPEGIVVGVSGGPDSVALLRALLAVLEDRTWPIVVAHLDHQTRGEASTDDERFVRQLVARLGGSDERLIYETVSRNVPALANDQAQNLEAVARDERYGWFAELAERHGCTAIATGHTADDQAETVLHRLIRGTGLQGLRGISPVRPVDSETPDIVVVRPLLRVDRRAVVEYLDAIEQEFRVDHTNADTRFLRNRIRHVLIPHLEAEFNGGIVDVLARLAEQSAEALEEDLRSTLALLQETELPRAGSVLVFDAHILGEVSRHRVRGLFRFVWQREGWAADSMDFESWERIADVAKGLLPAVDVAGRIHVRRREKVVRVEPPG